MKMPIVLMKPGAHPSSSPQICHRQPDEVLQSFVRSKLSSQSSLKIILSWWAFVAYVLNGHRDGDTASPANSGAICSPDEGSQDTRDKTKRGRDAHRNLDEDDEDQDSNENKQTRIKAKAPESQKLLACPYFKRYPDVFSRSKASSRPEACAGPGWTTVYRMKEHLFRKHAPPRNQCPRCLQSFEFPSKLVEHQRTEVPCEMKNTEDAPMRFNSNQESELKQRTKGSLSRTEEEKWIKIYGILFPEQKVPSPYYDYDSSRPTEFIDFFQAEFPCRLEQALEALKLNEEIIHSVMIACRTSQTEVYKDWQSSQLPLPCSSEETGLQNLLTGTTSPIQENNDQHQKRRRSSSEYVPWTLPPSEDSILWGVGSGIIDDGNESMVEHFGRPPSQLVFSDFIFHWSPEMGSVHKDKQS